MSREDLEYLTDEEFAELRAKIIEARKSLETAKRDANDRHACGVMLIVFGELRALLDRFLYARGEA